MLAALIRKELLALRRDPHAMGALFVMPAVFIMVMSLALMNLYSPPLEGLDYAFEVREETALGKRFMRAWEEKHGPARALPGNAREALRRGQLAYVMVIERGMADALGALAAADAPVLRLSAEPGLERGVLRALHAELAGTAGELRAAALLAQLTGLMAVGGQSIHPFIAAEQLGSEARPSAVQHNVPAWLVFGMFFVVTALAGLFVQEQRDGTLARLAGIGVPNRVQVLAKALPYVGVNALQAVLMLAVGVFVVPLLGGDALSLAGIDWSALVLVLLSISAAAIGFALLLACLARSHAQANAFGPLCNIVMAAIGGIMVPTFVMPPAMQTLAAFSPMNWGLEGLLSVLLRHGTLAEAAPWAWRLTAFGAAALLAANHLFARRIAP